MKKQPPVALIIAGIVAVLYFTGHRTAALIAGVTGAAGFAYAVYKAGPATEKASVSTY